MAAREEVDSVTQARVFDELGKTWLATPDELAARTGLAVPTVASALAGWVQAGRAIFDLDRGVYRKRELTRDPLPMEKLRFSNAREQAAAQLLHTGKIAIDRADTAAGGLVLGGRIRVGDRLFAPELTFDVEQRLVAGECSCDYFVRNRLHRGPCEHMLALRAAHRRGINDTITFEATRKPGRVPGGAVAANDEVRENFQLAFRKAVTRAAELTAAGRVGESIAELERIAKLAPPDSEEYGRLQEVTCELKLGVKEFEAARAAADRACPCSSRPARSALRVEARCARPARRCAGRHSDRAVARGRRETRSSAGTSCWRGASASRTGPRCSASPRMDCATTPRRRRSWSPRALSRARVPEGTTIPAASGSPSRRGGGARSTRSPASRPRNPTR